MRRDELAREATDLQKHVTPEKIERLTRLLRDKLLEGPAGLRQTYARLLMDEVAVTEEEIRISGSKAVWPDARRKTIFPVR